VRRWVSGHQDPRPPTAPGQTDGCASLNAPTMMAGSVKIVAGVAVGCVAAWRAVVRNLQ